MNAPEPQPARPLLQVVAGDATPEEIAAVVAAVALSSAATAGVPSSGPAPPTSIWSAPARTHRHVRATFTPGPHGWRTSFWPR